MASKKDLWEVRRSAARAILQGLVNDHTEWSQGAKVKTVYMDACPTRDDVHPAIAIVEEAHFAGCKQDGMFHQGQAQKYTRAIEDIDALSYEEEAK